jgi:hypothetical protein
VRSEGTIQEEVLRSLEEVELQLPPNEEDLTHPREEIRVRVVEEATDGAGKSI